MKSERQGGGTTNRTVRLPHHNRLPFGPNQKLREAVVITEASNGRLPTQPSDDPAAAGGPYQAARRPLDARHPRRRVERARRRGRAWTGGGQSPGAGARR